MADPRDTPVPVRTSRELSGRVEQEFHRRPDPFRRFNWRLSWGACAVVAVWIGVTFATGRRTIFEAGPVAPAHRFFENDCQACHNTWAPGARLVGLGGSGAHAHSVDDAKCQRCHAGSAHFAGQDPPHEGVGCASCHREHRHDASLIATSNRQCVACHQSLEGHLPMHASTDIAVSQERPAASITSFSDDHPEFDAVGRRDDAHLAFNHSVHLRHEYGQDGKLVKGIQNETGQLEDLSNNCTACHQPDAERKYMQPIRYAQHCQRCHPLFFDIQHFPHEVVPHGVATAALRGFLLDRYTDLAARYVDVVEPAPPVRTLPGHAPTEGRLTPEDRQRIRDGATNADERLTAPIAATEEAARAAAQRREKVLFGPESLGGCRLCHQLTESSTTKDARGFAAEWAIQPPDVPERWYVRSRFSHNSHRIVACTACHRDSSFNPPRAVNQSELTSDVLMPSIASCRTCHADGAHVPLPGGAVGSGPGVASRCIDCHDYHRRDQEPMNGAILDLFKPRVAEKDES